MAREFKLPDLGEGITEGQIVRVLCAVGDRIAEDQAILEVETDKAAVEIPSPFAGVASKVHVKEGDTVAVGQVLVTFDGDGSGADGGKAKGEAKKESGSAAKKSAPEKDKKSDKPREEAAGRPQEDKASPAGRSVEVDEDAPARAAEDGPKRTRAAAAPAVRKFAREQGVDIDSLRGSGPGGRVLQSDVEAAAGGSGAGAAGRPAAPARKAAVPTKTFAQIEGEAGSDHWGNLKKAKLTQIRKTIARQMVKSVSTIPHVTHTDEADVTLLEEMRRGLREREGSGPKITLMSFLLRTLAQCLRQHPIFNASFDDENEQIIYKQYINIGIAVDSPRGLVVPVMRNVDELSIRGIAQETGRLAEKVRSASFAIEELRGGTFTVTNYGAIGGIFGTPIINHPEVAILGVGRTQSRLVLSGERVQTRQYLPLSLSFDHRAADGAQAGRFMNDVVAHLSNPGLLLVD